MASASLSINGLSMCGVVGESGASSTFSVWDIWLSYCKYFQKNIAEDCPASVVRNLATWTLCGDVIPAPESVLVTLIIE